MTDSSRGYQQIFAEMKRRPQFDEVRDHPLVRAAIRDHGMQGMALWRTPPEQRRRPLSLERESTASNP